VLDPANPAQMIQAPSLSLTSDIFCAGQSWDALGRLVIAGGFNHPFPPDEVYRFDPAGLGHVGYTIPAPGQPPVAHIAGQSTTVSAWTSLSPEMSVPRYYPTLIPTLRDVLSTECTPTFSVGGGSSWILGGWTAGSGTPIDLWEYVQVSATGVGPYVLYPTGGSTVPGWTVPATAQEYARISLSGQPLPDPRLDQYPRAFQLSSKDALIVNDVEGLSAAPWTNPRGVARVIRTPVSTNLTPRCWELHTGPSAEYLEPIPGSSPPTNALITNDRSYGTAVLLHTLGVRDRVLTFGGSERAPALLASGWWVTRSVQEFARNSQPSQNPIATGSWTPRQRKVDMAEPRIFLNAVVLPTGQILLVGGGRVDTGHGQDACMYSDPVFEPELYEPGFDSSATGSTRLLRTSNPSPTGFPSPRLYHSLAVLLPDGRVFVGGGEEARIPQLGCPGTYPSFADSGFSGEVYYPPYLHQGFRPTLADVPSRKQLGMSMSVTVTWSSGHTVPRFAFLRPAAVTHHFDNDQRYIEAEAGAPTDVTDDGAGNLTGTFALTTPSADLAPPGFYMLSAVERSSGASPVLVPSMAAFINLF